jgi:hypothetical protein
MSAVFTQMIDNFFNGYHNSVVHKDQVLPECSLEFFSLFVESRVWVRKVEGIIPHCTNCLLRLSLEETSFLNGQSQS